MMVVCNPRALRRPVEYKRCCAGPECTRSRERRNCESMKGLRPLTLECQLGGPPQKMPEMQQLTLQPRASC
jgi:hypothetical protein